MKVLLGSARSSPGVTTATLALASVLTDPTLVVEASEDAGVLPARYGVRHDPGLTSLVAAMRHGTGRVPVARHTQPLPGTGGRVMTLTGPATADAATSALRAAGELLGATLAGLSGAVLVDAGRLRPGGPTVALAGRMGRCLLVARPRTEEAQALAQLVPALREARVEVGLLIVDDGPYPPAEVAAAVGLPLVGVLPHDRRSADALAGVTPTRGLRHLPLLRAATQLTAGLQAVLRPVEVTA